MIVRDPFPTLPETGLSTEVIADIVVLARAYDAQVAASDPDSGSNAADDRGVDALDEHDNAIGRELAGAISALDDEKRHALVALAWVGRGDFEPEDWAEAARTARERANDGPTTRYLMGLSLLGDLLEEGADKMGLSLTEDETEALHAEGGEPPAEDDRD